MNYTKIYAVMAKQRKISIWRPVENEQWLIASDAMYNVDGLPELDCENVLPLIGVDSESSAKYTVSYFDEASRKRIEKYIRCNDCEGDGFMVQTKLAFDGVSMLRGEGSNAPACIFIKSEWLRPFAGQSVDFIYRQAPDLPSGSLIIIKQGLLTVGAVAPFNFKERAVGNGELISDLRAAALKIEEQSKDDDDYEQTEL